ncbi:MobA/MobL family protein [Gimibacter soli]|uniref:MobA/MobL family protein n=1 Tax=Gimibacter soli TaxID=3024400 RepID=A0AAE9XQS5_9PROT|nr:MobA/MobL family protein [Gimibacter soli]WCL55583.1 MobA/MobL family protein [Gimibacter soli]
MSFDEFLANLSLGRDDFERVKMGRLTHDEEREALALVRSTELERQLRHLLEGTGGRQVVPFRFGPKRLSVNDRQPFHFHYQSHSRARQEGLPLSRLLYRPLGTEWPKGTRRHERIRDKQSGRTLVSLPIRAMPPKDWSPVPRTQAVFLRKGIAPGTNAWFATEYLIRAEAVETDKHGALIYASRDALKPELWQAIEDIERRGDGRLQTRIIAELPYESEIGPWGRREIARKFAVWFEELGLPHVIVVHRPDDHGDQRNYHLHVVFHDRSISIVDGDLWWENRKDPRFYAGKKSNGPVVELRRLYADLCNEQFAWAGLPRRFDPASYKELGIEAHPAKHLGKDASALERSGQRTASGDQNFHIALERSYNLARDAYVGRRSKIHKALEDAQKIKDRLVAAHRRVLSIFAEEGAGWRLARREPPKTKRHARARPVEASLAQAIEAIETSIKSIEWAMPIPGWSVFADWRLSLLRDVWPVFLEQGRLAELANVMREHFSKRYEAAHSVERRHLDAVGANADKLLWEAEGQVHLAEAAEAWLRMDSGEKVELSPSGPASQYLRDWQPKRSRFLGW